MSTAIDSCEDREIDMDDTKQTDVISNNLDSFKDEGITFLIITTPVPPMPLIILREGVGDNHHTNSYDLLQSVIKQSHMKCESMDREDLEKIRAAKLEAYGKMWDAIQNLNNGSNSPLDPPCDWTITAIQEAYSIFQKYFRDMIQIYTSTTSTPDIRFMPLDYLTPSDFIVHKTRDHLMALTQVWDSFHPSNPADHQMIYDRKSLDYLSYYQLVGMYAHKIRLMKDV